MTTTPDHLREDVQALVATVARVLQEQADPPARFVDQYGARVVAMQDATTAACDAIIAAGWRPPLPETEGPSPWDAYVAAYRAYQETDPHGASAHPTARHMHALEAALRVYDPCAELEEWRAAADAGGQGWVLRQVREALGTPGGRAVSVHAAEVRAERDQARAQRDEAMQHAGHYREDALQGGSDERDTTSTMVREFHEAFGVAIDADDTPALRSLRQSLITEEAREVSEALGWEKPLEDVAKELADLAYVVHGTAVSLGIDLDEAVRRVHASNMSKRNPDGTVSYREDGKILKPDGYRPPDMAGVVRVELQGDQPTEPDRVPCGNPNADCGRLGGRARCGSCTEDESGGQP